MRQASRFPKRATRARRGTSKPRRAGLGLSVRHRRLRIEVMEDRTLLSVAPMNVALVSDAVARAEQIRQAAAKDTIAIIYDADSMTTAGLVDLLGSVSAAHDGARIGHLGIVTHGGAGQVDLGTGDGSLLHPPVAGYPGRTGHSTLSTPMLQYWRNNHLLAACGDDCDSRQWSQTV